MEEVIKGYKGFEKDMTCRGFRYEEGKEYEEDKAKVCDAGFHACEYPLDCFNYYAPSTSVYHEVEQSGKLSKSSDDSKVSATKIKIGARIGIPGLVQAAIEYTTERAKPTEDTHNTGDYGASSNTGTAEQPLTQGTAVLAKLIILIVLLRLGVLNQKQKA